jgi:hypothetical protein
MTMLRRLALLALAAAAVHGADADRLRQSWLHFDETDAERVLGDHQTFTMTLEYELAPGPPATLTLQGLGPWIDLPDGTYETKRHHVSYPGLSAKAEIAPGHGRQVFTFTTPAFGAHGSILWVAQFHDPDGKAWPWEVRGSGGVLRHGDGWARIESAVPGNLFTYGQPLRFALVLGSRLAAGSSATAAWKVIGRDGAPLASGTLPVTAAAPGQRIPLAIEGVERRGILGLEVTLAGEETLATTFGRIPDVLAITKGEATRFGMHHLVHPGPPAMVEAAMDMARRLGLTCCRTFLPWQAIEPARGLWKLEAWDKALERAKAHGIDALLCVGDPPPWVMRDRMAVGYQAFAFDEAGWREAATTMTRRWRGKLAAWEWLNEIVPGDVIDPVNTYLSFCRIGTAAARAEDPTVRILLAGGLWPRNFRLGLLAGGVAQDIDVLPIHYGALSGVAEARLDLEAAGARDRMVWDDETGRGISTWHVPLAEALHDPTQQDWVMGQWPGELAAGAARLLYFGGEGDPAGNWDYCHEDLSPRPVAATLAVLASKLHRAVPQGSFMLGAEGPFHLFAVGGRAVLVAPKAHGRDASAALVTGAAALTVSDDQGEERRLAASDRTVTVPLAGRATLVEGGDLEVLRAYTVPELLTPTVSLLAGSAAQLRLRLTNRGTTPLSGTVQVEFAAGWQAAAPAAFSVKGGEDWLVEVVLTAPMGAPAGEQRLHVRCHFADARLPEVVLPYQLVILDAKRLGNLLVNGGFEGSDAQGKPTAWNLDKGVQLAPPEDFGEALGTHVLRFGPSSGWQSAGQSVTLAGERSYLYSAWVLNRGKDAGSNIYQQFADGSSKPLFTPAVFSAGTSTPDWQLMSCIFRAPANLVAASFCPVANGKGTTQFDNLRLTAYEGTAFAAEAVKVATPPTIDGDLSDWGPGCPIPLLGPGQTTVHDPSWTWSADNLRAVVRLAWDEKNLYLAAWVTDDVLCAPFTGDRTPDSDSLVLALHPGNRAAGEDARAFAFYLSPASPGGGSGRFTLFRPASHCGGLSSGQLARDSSVYELAIRREGNRTLYEARLPWSELGASGRLGTKLGLSLQLNDNDGKGRAAHISWGDGLFPNWTPTAFGVLTLVE